MLILFCLARGLLLMFYAKNGVFCPFFNYKIFDISPILCWWWNISQGNFELFPCKKSNCSWLRFPFTIVCFATRENRMCKRFYSAAWEYECEAVNFFRQRISPEEVCWQTVEPGEWCSSSACPPCLGSSGSSMVGKSLDSSRTSTGSSLPGSLLLELKVHSSGDQLGRKSSLSSLTSGSTILWILFNSTWKSAFLGKKKKENNSLILY